jgi:hypothetical protein
MKRSHSSSASTNLIMGTTAITRTFKHFRYAGQQARNPRAELLANFWLNERLERSTPNRMCASTSAQCRNCFAGDAFALHAFLTAFYADHRYDADAFLHRQNFFAQRNLTAFVLEIPSRLIGEEKVHAWATISLYGHVPKMQVSRWGLPLITHLFLNDPNAQGAKEQFNTSVPSADMDRFSKPIADFTEKVTKYAAPLPILRTTRSSSLPACAPSHCPTSLAHLPHSARSASMDALSATMQWM